MRPLARELPLTLTKAQRSAIAEVCPRFRSRLALDDRPLQAAHFQLDELRLIHQDVSRALRFESDGRRRHSLNCISTAVQAAMRRFFQIDAIPISRRIYQFRITLHGITPEIWRRIQVKDCTLSRLHRHIQRAMGWWDYHLYSFEKEGVEYADPDWIEGFYGEDAGAVRLSEFVPKDGSRYDFLYTYDFGDGWNHEILFEGCLPAEEGARYPLCLEGARACPPENVGGPHGFENYLAAMTDPTHEEHESCLKWRGPYDPEEFSTDAATARMAKRR